MKFEENILQVADLRPDFMGFIFYPESRRHFEGRIPELHPSIRKIGVFVNEYLDVVVEKVKTHGLDGVQLHGEEEPRYCAALREGLNKPGFSLIKAFRIGDSIDFDTLRPYEGLCDHFLFDTLGKERGGTGKKFDWEALAGYDLQTPYLLSGGIGPEDLESLAGFLSTEQAALCQGIDLNSRFEDAPGMKNTEKLKKFVDDFKELER